VRCGADDRRALERLARYITRPALAHERVQIDAAGQVVLRLKTAWRDGTTHVVMSPREFLQRLAALVPRPRLHLTRYHGVPAPNSKLRAWVVPRGPQTSADSGQASEDEGEPRCRHRCPSRIPWAQLLQRVFEIDMAHCPNCGGELRVIAAILETAAIERTLTHLGLQPRAPPRAPARQMALQAS
jgi:Putative transposase